MASGGRVSQAERRRTDARSRTVQEASVKLPCSTYPPRQVRHKLQGLGSENGAVLRRHRRPEGHPANRLRLHGCQRACRECVYLPVLQNACDTAMEQRTNVEPAGARQRRRRRRR